MDGQIEQNSDSKQSFDRDGDRIKYQEVCASHRAITEFRGKLLTLLPIASGAGVYLIMPKNGSLEGLDTVYLIAIGVFGFFITLGLFLHELRGIQHCGELIELGAFLESKIGGSEGHFCKERNYYHDQKGWRKFYNNLKGPVGAAAVIYPSVGIAWLYVAALGFKIPSISFAWSSLIILALVFVLLILFIPPSSGFRENSCASSK